MPHKRENQLQPDWKGYVAIGIRRRWLILIPLFVCWAMVWGYSWHLPTYYKSEALILVEQKKVADLYVVSNVNQSFQARLQSITQQALSRTRLQAIITEFHLYARRHRFLKTLDPVDQMRNDIVIEPVQSPEHPGDFSAFKVSYFANTPRLAQRVNQELTSLFVERSLQSQKELSENTTAFLENQVADARKKMEKQEARVAAFKREHMGDLPGQLEGNVQILAGLQTQLTNVQHALDASKQQRIYLESLLQQYQSATSTETTTDTKELSTQQRLNDLRARYTDNYPDVVALKEQIAKEEANKKQEGEAASSDQKSGQPTSTNGTAAVGGLQNGSPTAMMQLQSQLSANQLETQNELSNEKELESQISAYQARLNLAPEIEQELVEISRGYDESKANYSSLLQKQMQSQLATSLEQQQQGEQFSIVDPPSFPDKPSFPNRFKISLAGLAFGTFFGLCLAALAEMRDVRVWQEKDLDGLVPAHMLVGIPRLSTAREDRLRSVRLWTELSAMAVLIILIAVGSFLSFHRG